MCKNFEDVDFIVYYLSAIEPYFATQTLQMVISVMQVNVESIVISVSIFGNQFC